jgi:hypothetical protein
MASAIKLKNQVTKLEAAKKAATKGKNTKLAAKFQSQIEVLKGQIKALNKPTGSPAVQAAKQLAREYKAKYGVSFNGIDIEKDALVPAFKTGRRVSQGIKGNQFASKGEAKGNVYYEYRENRIDRNAKRYPKLADGGVMAKGGVIGNYRVLPLKEVGGFIEPYYSLSFPFNGSLSEANEEAQKYVKNNENIIAAEVIKIHPSGQAIKNKKVSYVTKDEIQKYADGGSLDSILLDTGGASVSNVGGTFYSNADLTPQMDITNPMFEHGGEIHRGEGGSMFAKGGMVEHGLKVGDEVKANLFTDNSVWVYNNKTAKSAMVNLNTGKRTEI